MQVLFGPMIFSLQFNRNRAVMQGGAGVIDQNNPIRPLGQPRLVEIDGDRMSRGERRPGIFCGQRRQLELGLLTPLAGGDQSAKRILQTSVLPIKLLDAAQNAKAAKQQAHQTFRHQLVSFRRFGQRFDQLQLNEHIQPGLRAFIGQRGEGGIITRGDDGKQVAHRFAISRDCLRQIHFHLGNFTARVVSVHEMFGQNNESFRRRRCFDRIAGRLQAGSRRRVTRNKKIFAVSSAAFNTG
ncbi:MAG: hypothetical protein ALAOOOJD_03022 [bacterium]|nr:hypothetical protein [bacterium]